MVPTLYHVPKTISSPIVQCLLELNVVDNPVVVHEMTFPELKSESHLAVNPMGTSPSFQDGPVIMWESGAVLDYLLERYDRDRKLYPGCLHHHHDGNQEPSDEQVAARAKYLHLKQYIIATVYPFVASLFVHKLKPAAEQDAEYVKSAQDKWTHLLGPVLTQWYGNGPYFLGDQISAVDFLVAKPLNNANSMGLLQDDFPALYDLFDRIRNRPTFQPAYVSMPPREPDTGKERPYEGRTIILIPAMNETNMQ